MTLLTQTEAELYEARQHVALLADMLRFALQGMHDHQHRDFRKQYPEARDTLTKAAKLSEVFHEQTG